MNLSHIELLYILQYGYIALFVVFLLGELTSFIPMGILLIAMGALARAGYFNLFFLLIVAALGSSVSDYIVFSIARHLGKREGYRRYVKNSALASRIECYAAKFPRSTIFLSRLVGFASTPANALFGLSQTSRPVFAVFDLLGNLLCAFLYLIVGYYLGAEWQANSQTAIVAIGVITFCIIASYIGFYFLLQKKSPENS